jgi:hypothetical protein
MSQIQVECYSGFRADQRPLRFTLGSRIFEVSQIDDQWYSPAAMYFRVRANDGNVYVLRHDEVLDTWSLDAFRLGP